MKRSAWTLTFVLLCAAILPAAAENAAEVVLEGATSLVVPKIPGFYAPRAARDGGSADPAVIDVMIVYTPAALNWATTSGGGISNVIAQVMNSANLALSNSQTLMSMNLAHSAQVTYTEGPSSEIDLVRLLVSPEFNPWGETYNGYPITGYLDEVHAWRDQYGADLTLLLTNVSDVGGISPLLDDSNGIPELGFSISRVQQASLSFTAIHEWGHAMGCHHHAAQSVQPGPTEWVNWPENTWSAGWRWVGTNNSRYCSIMSYTSGAYYPDGLSHTRVAYFSNPSVIHQEMPTGDPALADNARTLREMRQVIAAYRMLPLAPANLQAAALSPGKVQLVWDDLSSNEEGFRLERRQGNGGEWTLAAELPADASSWLDTGLLAQNTYTYRVRAFHAPCVSTWAYSAEVGTPALATPQELDAQITAGCLTLSWLPVEDAWAYRVYASDTPSGEYAPDPDGVFAGASWSRDLSGARRFYRVTATQTNE